LKKTAFCGLFFVFKEGFSDPWVARIMVCSQVRFVLWDFSGLAILWPIPEKA
jgi:hypothetical protein